MSTSANNSRFRGIVSFTVSLITFFPNSSGFYRWYGDVFDDDLPYVQSFGDRRLAAIPLGTDVNDMQFMKFGNVPHLMLDSFNENLDVARAQGERPAQIDVTVHAHIFGRPRGAYYYQKIIERAASCDDVWIATRAEVADHILAQNVTSH
jgi:hypothetical protein